MEYEFTYLGEPHKITVEGAGNFKTISVDGKDRVKVEGITLENNSLAFVIGGKVFTTYIAREGEKYFIFADGNVFTFERRIGVSSIVGDVSVKFASKAVVSSMPGLLVKLLVSYGSRVKVGETVAIVEAMKMENELKSPIDGVVKKINFNEGEQVDAFSPIIELEEI